MALAPPSSAGEPTGGASSGATDDGSAPVKVGGVFHASSVTLSDGQRGDFQLALNGGVIVSGTDILGDTISSNSTGVRSSASATARALAAAQYAFNGTSFDRARTPSVFKQIDAAITAGTPQAIWTPAAGKKFRLMGFYFIATAATTLKLIDNVTTILNPGFGASVPAPSPPMGNGILSAAANNVLSVDLTVSTTVHGFVFGTEE